MSKRTLQRWYPRNFNEIVGNNELTDYGRYLLKKFRCEGQFGGDHAAITGRSRSGKSSLVALVKRALTCLEFDFETLTPCDSTCAACHMTPALLGNDGWDYRPPILAKTSVALIMNVRTVDCASLTANLLADLIDTIRTNTGPTDHYLVHLEEVHWLGEKGLDQRLLAPMDELESVTWIATSAYVKKEDAQVRKLLNQMLLNRFPYRISTLAPSVDDLAIWLAERCVEFTIDVETPAESTLRHLAERSKQIAGSALQVLVKAERYDHYLTRALIDNHFFSFDD